ncbi:MAG: (2Fe-2S)-binding protein [Tractidigestivibacter sp.]|jgi:carbon-monoxide dehydrogenase small subunit|uniref:(2Fe-2S)-binding protein n=1 Tax=Tractidigestivibacter sp. TaxID=2847320 RepID=UPI003D9333DB
MSGAAEPVRVRLRVNGFEHDLLVDPGDRLIDVLRDGLGLTGTKEGCGIGVCGACTVLVDGRAENSCLVPAASLDGASVTTVEGLADGGQLSALQESFLRHHAIQCGFCTPGLLLAATSLLSEDPHPTETRVRESLRGNLCRCTGYEQVVEAILDVSGTAVDANPDVVVDKRGEGGRS